MQFFFYFFEFLPFFSHSIFPLVLALIGNKIDLMEEEQVNYDEAISYAKVFFHFFQT